MGVFEVHFRDVRCLADRILGNECCLGLCNVYVRLHMDV